MFPVLKRFFHHFFFLHSSPLVKLSRKKILVEADFLPLPENLNPMNSQTLQKLDWSLQPLRFLWSLLRVYKSQTRKGYAFLALALLGLLISPNLVHLFIDRLSHNGDLPGNFLVGFALSFCGISTGICFQQYFYYYLQTWQMATNDLNQLIFNQSLRLSLQSRGQSQIGDVVNHMSSDSDSIAEFSALWGDLISAFVSITIASAMLFFYIGWSALAALLVMAGLAPLTQFVAKNFIHFEKSLRVQRDHRVTVISQILNAIRVVKFFSWEKAVTAEVNSIRNKELNSRQRLARAEVLSGISYVAVGTIVLFVALMVHAWRGFTLDAATLFTCISLFALLEEPFGQLSRLFSKFSQAVVAVARVRDFLALPTVEKEGQIVLPVDSPLALELTNVDFYHTKPDDPVLKNISLKVSIGESIAIVGPVGAGKSSLLYGFLGECRSSQGTSQINKSLFPLAYVPQEAYIINSSLLENLKFGSSLATKEYLRKCIHAACLEKDIRDLPAGLKTEIGEKGVNLSGGQKQRVSLGRAALVNPQFVLLDDPLSAVDVDTERLICDRLLFGLWKDITRVVVTHRLESLSRFDRVIFLRHGEICAQGKFAEILQNSKEFAKFYAEHEKQDHETEKTAALEITTASEDLVESRITEDEEREKGAVKSTVYWDYIQSLGGRGRKKFLILSLLAGGAILATGFPLLQKWWLSYFSNHQSGWTTINAIWIYGALGLLVLLSNLLNQIFWLERGIAAGRDMHERMLQSLLKAPIRFFDSTPVGRILQRFSRDIESVDIYLQWSFEQFIHCVLQIVVSLILILVVLPAMIFVIAPILWIYYLLQNDYRRPAREAKRLDSVARSPRYAHFKETLVGLPVIRAFRREKWFVSEFFSRLQHSQRMFYGHYMINRWFSARVPLLGGLISLATVAGVAYAVDSKWIDSGMAGLLTIYSMSFWAQLNWSIRIFADIESRMTSVERLKFYSTLESEEKPTSQIPKLDWPLRGEIRWKDVQARYAPHLPWVLKGVNFHIQPGQKVGIIGRTGSGKSTLFQALYRFIEIESGVIELDGVDLSTVPLDRLRKSLAIVPQDPTLFLGTLRTNLDRYNECTDEEIHRALHQTGLDSFVQKLPQGLDSSVQENGANLSQGQRQLLCLARALLLKAKVVLMDEATASVDVQTDALIQKVIRDSLKETTMIIIAHRLGTIADCDQIIEMQDGQVVSMS